MRLPPARGPPGQPFQPCGRSTRRGGEHAGHNPGDAHPHQAGAPGQDRDSGRAERRRAAWLLVFLNEEQAEAFRRETGRFPASEGFIAQATNLEGLKAIQLVWKFPRVVLRGPESDTVSEYDADEFMAMLEGAEMVRPLDLQA